MWHKKFYITYVDGEVIHLTTNEWESARPEGIERIDSHGFYEVLLNRREVVEHGAKCLYRRSQNYPGRAVRV